MIFVETANGVITFVETANGVITYCESVTIHHKRNYFRRKIEGSSSL